MTPEEQPLPTGNDASDGDGHRPYLHQPQHEEHQQNHRSQQRQSHQQQQRDPHTSYNSQINNYGNYNQGSSIRTSGRSPAPPRTNISGVGGRASFGSHSIGGASSLGRSSIETGRLSYDTSFSSDHHTHHTHNGNLSSNAANASAINNMNRSTSGFGSSNRLSVGTRRLYGTRLSYGTTPAYTNSANAAAASSNHPSRNANATYATNAPHSANPTTSGSPSNAVSSPTSISSMNNSFNSEKLSDKTAASSAFFAALSPSTAQYLSKGQHSTEAMSKTDNVGNNKNGAHGGDGEDEASTSMASASAAAATAMRMAGNAPRGIDDLHPTLDNKSGAKDSSSNQNEGQECGREIDGIYNLSTSESLNGGDNDATFENRKRELNHDKKNNYKNEKDKKQQQQQQQQYQTFLAQFGQDAETVQLRSFVQSLLGIRLPADGQTSLSPNPFIPSTPDPANALFFALTLLSKTNGSRPDDAYLAARAMALNGEGRRAIWTLDRAGLIGVGAGDVSGSFGPSKPFEPVDGVDGWNEEGKTDEKQACNGVRDLGKDFDISNSDEVGDNIHWNGTQSQHVCSTDGEFRQPYKIHEISNVDGIRNGVLLRAEAALLGGQCFVQVGEFERAIAIYEEAMRFPPPPPPLAWGWYGYGYCSGRKNELNADKKDNAGNIVGSMGAENEHRDFDEGVNFKIAGEKYIPQWREQSSSHMALIDEGNDERLIHLAESIQRLPFSPVSKDESSYKANVIGIHPIARLCVARGIAYNELSNPHRALPFLRMALTIDARCSESFDYVIRKRLLTPDQEREWMSSLNWGEEGENRGHMIGMSWLRDSYLARLRGRPGATVMVQQHHSCSLQNETSLTCKHRHETNERGNILDASSGHHVGLQTPSEFFLGSPDLGVRTENTHADSIAKTTDIIGNDGKLVKHSAVSMTIDEAFFSLAKNHGLGKSPDTLSLAAIRAYSTHDLRSALAYCTAIDAIDPYCRTAGYVHVAALVGLGLKRRLFQLAHRLVDADPKDALAWFAVGSYYHLCKRYDLAQRHFSRSTRLDPSNAECWIGFGCSFAVCDESDQALASFRAAQNKYSGSHIPLLYMGMEYLRTNHLSLAGHFLTSAQKTDPSDPMCCNELGVWSFRRGDFENSVFWFVKALRLHAESESSALSSTDESLGMNGYILFNRQCAKENSQKESETYEKSKHGPTPPSCTSSNSKFADDNKLPVSTVLCARNTPSGKSVAASIYNDAFCNALSDIECLESCKDKFWEPTIFNLGQAYRKMRRYIEAIKCFEKCSSLNPGNFAAYSALGFALHLYGDVDGAIDSYHEALSRKPDDHFSSEMLNRALAEAVTYPKSSVFNSFKMHQSDSNCAEQQQNSLGSTIAQRIMASGTNKNINSSSGVGGGI